MYQMLTPSPVIILTSGKTGCKIVGGGIFFSKYCITNRYGSNIIILNSRENPLISYKLTINCYTKVETVFLNSGFIKVQTADKTEYVGHKNIQISV